MIKFNLILIIIKIKFIKKRKINNIKKMYDNLISKMTEYFSEIGLILNSKALNYFEKSSVLMEDIEMYYDYLCSDEIIPQNINRRNHKMCCLYYLSENDSNYIDNYVDNYMGAIELNSLEINSENLIMVFNIIEFDKTYLKSDNNNEFLYAMLKKFANFETYFENFITYKYYREYIKFKLGDIKEAIKEYFSIILELEGNEDIFMKYMKILNHLLKLQINKYEINLNKFELNENIKFLEFLYSDISESNKVLSIKIGFELFSAYLEVKEYNKCMLLILKMNKSIKKDLLKGSSIKNGIYNFLAIANRIGYIGVLLNNKKVIEKAIKKIKKVFRMIGNDINDQKLLKLFQAHKFSLAILQICLNQKSENNISEISNEFKKIFLPDLKKYAIQNDIIDINNRDNIIINLEIINNKDKDIYFDSNFIIAKNENILNKEKNSNTSNFIIFLSSCHNKIYRYLELYTSSKKKSLNNNNIDINYVFKIKKYFQTVDDIINKNIEDPFLQTEYAKILIIDIYYTYASILLEKKDEENLNKIMQKIMDNQNNNLRSKLKIDNNIPSYGLWLKLKGDYYLYKKIYDAACINYEDALKTLEPNHPQFPLILFYCGCSYYFIKNKEKSVKYLEQCIYSFGSINRGTNYFGHYPKEEFIKKKIETVKKLLEILKKFK